MGLIALILSVAACGEERQLGNNRPAIGTRGAPETALPAELPDLARALVPAEALEPPTKEDLAVKECGIQPVFPCVRVYFVTEDISLEERLAIVRRQADAAGWDIISEQREGGATVGIQRGAYQGTYMLESDDALLCASAPRCITGTMLTVLGPPAPLPTPSAAERQHWSAEKKGFVDDANAVCAAMQARMIDPERIAAALAEGLRELSALEAPSGELKEVDAVLRPLGNLARAAEALSDDEGEDALPAAVAVGEFTKRFTRAASRYGLDTCATLG
jgi:hypothetical protein